MNELLEDVPDREGTHDRAPVILISVELPVTSKISFNRRLDEMGHTPVLPDLLT